MGILRGWATRLFIVPFFIIAVCGPIPNEDQAKRHDPCAVFTCDEGGIIRGDTGQRKLALVFTGGDFADGGVHIRTVLRNNVIPAGFFFTGDFYRNSRFSELIQGLAADGHYLGPHSDRHLLYCDWDDRRQTLVTPEEFRKDMLANYREMERFGIAKDEAPYFIPPFEWFNADIVRWSKDLGLVLINFTPGTSSNADFTTPSMPHYLSSQAIYDRILEYEKNDPDGLNGFILLIHIGTDPERTDKFYFRLEDIIGELRQRGYACVRIDDMLRISPVS